MAFGNVTRLSTTVRSTSTGEKQRAWPRMMEWFRPRHLWHSAANPIDMHFHSPSDTIRGKREVNGTPKFERKKIADNASAITRFLWSIDPRPALFLPYEHQLRAPIPPEVPPH